MKKITLLIGCLTIGTLSAQIKTNTKISQNDTSNSFLDASQNATNFGNSVGRGLNFPHTDLSVFRLNEVDEIETPNFYDGMIIYNTKDGGNTNDPALAVQTQDLKPGFYYFSNPNGATTQSVRQGKWVRLGGESVTPNLWRKNGENAQLYYPTNDYTVQYTKDGGYKVYPTQDVNYPSVSLTNSKAKYDWNILTEVNALNKHLTKSSDIIVENTNNTKWGEFRIHKINTNFDAESGGYNFQTVISEDDIMEGKIIRNIFNNVEHLGNTKVESMEGTYGSAALNGPHSSANSITGGLFDAVSNSSVEIGDMYGLTGRIRLAGTGKISRVFGIRSMIGLRGRNNDVVSSNIDKLYGMYIGYNGLGNDRYTGNIANAYDIYIESANYDGLKNRIEKSYGFYINGAHKINYLSGKLGIGVDEPSEKLEVAGNIKSSSLASTGNRRVYADANGVLKIGTEDLNTLSRLWKENASTNSIQLAINSDGSARTTAVDILDNGKIKATSFQGVNGATIFPDYVFQKYYTGTSNIKSDYNFKSLSQVEDFVKVNGHLPGYKSAETIKAQGYVDLMETQLTNVEKIEELYLHSIEQDKVNKQQAEALKAKDAEIADLKQRLERLEKLIQ